MYINHIILCVCVCVRCGCIRIAIDARNRHGAQDAKIGAVFVIGDFGSDPRRPKGGNGQRRWWRRRVVRRHHQQQQP